MAGIFKQKTTKLETHFQVEEVKGEVNAAGTCKNVNIK